MRDGRTNGVTCVFSYDPFFKKETIKNVVIGREVWDLGRLASYLKKMFGFYLKKTENIGF